MNLYCSERTRRKLKPSQELDIDRILNAQGLVVLVVYISLVLSVALPFQCVWNPNGTKSLASNPAVVCWESDVHGALAGLGVVGVFCYPVAILSLVGYITLQRPKMIASGRGVILVRRFRWLFNRFTPERWSAGSRLPCEKRGP